MTIRPAIHRKQTADNENRSLEVLKRIFAVAQLLSGAAAASVEPSDSDRKLDTKTQTPKSVVSWSSESHPVE